MLRFLAIQKSFKRTPFVPPGDRRVRASISANFAHAFSSPVPKSLVIRMGTQAGTASPIHFAHARRDHQIPADQGQRGGVAGLHRLFYLEDVVS